MNSYLYRCTINCHFDNVEGVIKASTRFVESNLTSKPLDFHLKIERKIDLKRLNSNSNVGRDFSCCYESDS